MASNTQLIVFDLMFMRFAVKRITPDIFAFFAVNEEGTKIQMPEGISVEQLGYNKPPIPLYENSILLTWDGHYTVYYHEKICKDHLEAFFW